MQNQMQNLAAQKVVDIRIIKGRRQEDIDAEAAARLKIRALAEEEYKTTVDFWKAKRSGIDMTFNDWIHWDGYSDFGSSSVHSKVAQTFIDLFKNQYDTPIHGEKRVICKLMGFEYDKTKGLHKLLAPEVSIERQMLTMMGEGWVTQGSVTTQGSLAGDGNGAFFQTMVKYEEEKSQQTLGMRHKTGAI
jgi:hypothetical protein